MTPCIVMRILIPLVSRARLTGQSFLKAMRFLMDYHMSMDHFRRLVQVYPSVFVVFVAHV
jgi:hypothetical protein